MDNTLIEKATTLLSIPLEDRTLTELSQLSMIKSQFASLIPYARKDMKLREIDADNKEKSLFLKYKIDKRDKKTTATENDMKANARLQRNKIESEVAELEFTYLTLYNFYQELVDSVVTTRMVLKV